MASSKKTKDEKKKNVSESQEPISDMNTSEPETEKKPDTQKSENRKASKKESKKKSRGDSEKGTKKKPGIFKRIGAYFRDLKNELKKVVWPTRKRLLHSTVVVLVMVILVAIFVCILDLIFNGAISLLFGHFSK